MVNQYFFQICLIIYCCSVVHVALVYSKTFMMCSSNKLLDLVELIIYFSLTKSDWMERKWNTNLTKQTTTNSCI